MKEFGNNCFREGNYESALVYYQRGIQLGKQCADKIDTVEMLNLYRNQAQTFLKLERFYEAYKAAKNASDIDENDEKVFYR